MFRRLLKTNNTPNVLHRYDGCWNIEKKYSTLSHTRQLNKSYTCKKHDPASFICSSKNITRFLNLSSAYSSVLPTHRNKFILRHKDIVCLDFTSSATANIERSDSNTASNIFKKLYRKLIPEPLSVSKTTLYRAGAILSACCTHEVIKLNIT